MPAIWPVRSLRMSGTAAKQAPVPACKNTEQPNADNNTLQRGQEEFIWLIIMYPIIEPTTNKIKERFFSMRSEIHPPAGRLTKLRIAKLDPTMPAVVTDSLNVDSKNWGNIEMTAS